uniref:Uncharacterized protein n=1 Tax=Oryza glumipatula TaxID=40148 RepID=A0A0D9YRK8_9ORYZ
MAKRSDGDTSSPSNKHATWPMRRPHHHHTTRPCKQLRPHPATTMKTQETAQHAKGLAFNLPANQPSPESGLPA